MIPANNGLTFLDCAQKVLEEFSGDQPMHYVDITEQARRQGWLVTAGKTPENTMHAQIVTAIKRQQARGEPQCFVQHGRGYFSLNPEAGSGLGLSDRAAQPAGTAGLAEATPSPVTTSI